MTPGTRLSVWQEALGGHPQSGSLRYEQGRLEGVGAGGGWHPNPVTGEPIAYSHVVRQRIMTTIMLIMRHKNGLTTGRSGDRYGYRYDIVLSSIHCPLVPLLSTHGLTCVGLCGVQDRLALWSGYMRQQPLNTPSFVHAFVPGLVKQV